MTLFTRLLACLLLSLLTPKDSFAQTPLDGPVHYIGFNDFPQDDLATSKEQFDLYLKKLKPIMERFGMTLSSYDVSYGGSEQLQADVITFGSAPTMGVMQAFFRDPEFQAIFPLLHGALSGHQVIFTSSEFNPKLKPNTHTLLALNWLKEDTKESQLKLKSLFSTLTKTQRQYGVNQLEKTSGLFSNTGLSPDEIQPTAAPHQIELWSLEDAHGYLDHSDTQKANKQAKEYIQRSEDFWITARN